MVGVSRKRFIGTFGGEPEPRQRLPASLAAGLYAVTHGAHILRVHDVAETVQALRFWHSLSGAGLSGAGLSHAGLNAGDDAAT